MKPFAINLSESAQLAIGGQRPRRAWLAWLPEGPRQLWASWAGRSRRHRDVQELAAFSDRDLWDVGLSRSDLLAISKGVYRRD